ncbi:MAG: thioredoxin family protein [Christensenellaceae bacterium]
MSKKVKMFVLRGCPYCDRAFEMMNSLKEKHPDYASVDIDIIEEREQAEKTKGYDFWYVPTYFVDDVKMLEGVPTMQAVEAVYIEALK